MKNIFKDCETNKDQGNMGEGYAIAYFMSKGYSISKPLTENQPYDFIIDDANELKKVQVKTSGFLIGVNKDRWAINVCTTGGNQSFYKKKYFDKSEVNYMFIVLSNGDMYYIPTDIIDAKTSLSIYPPKYYEYRVFLDESKNEFLEKEEIINKLKKELKDKNNKIKALKEYSNRSEYSKNELSDKEKEYYKERRKVKRPPYKQLMEEINASNYCAVGRKYGVSDNAIRKWVKYYEKHE